MDATRGVESAIATIALDGFGDEGFEHAFKIVPQLGIRSVEFNVWFPRTVTLEGMKRIEEGARGRASSPSCLQGSGSGGNVIKDVTHKLWLMEMVKRLGARRGGSTRWSTTAPV